MQEIEAFAAIGRADGGVDRPGFSLAEREAKERLQSLLEAEGCKVQIDGAGNLFARREGSDPSLGVILTGSHLDTVPTGGKLDGALGVIAGLEVIRALNEAQITTRHPFELVCFIAEEASRFGLSTFGSRALRGALTAEELGAVRDRDGVSVECGMRQAGVDPKEALRVKWERKGSAFIELHIEQGPLLERRSLQIGIVTAIANSTRYKVTLKGEAAHSGSTPIAERHDALFVASQIVCAVRYAAEKYGEGVGVATVGAIEAKPGSISVIPGEATLGIDIRDVNAETKQHMARAICDEINRICAEEGVEAKVVLLKDAVPVPNSPLIVSALEAEAFELGIPYTLMHSGAGHDAMNMASLMPTGMIFVPSCRGISHNPAEWTEPDDIHAGVSLLAQTLLRLDRELN